MMLPKVSETQKGLTGQSDDRDWFKVSLFICHFVYFPLQHLVQKKVSRAQDCLADSGTTLYVA